MPSQLVYVLRFACGERCGGSYQVSRPLCVPSVAVGSIESDHKNLAPTTLWVGPPPCVPPANGDVPGPATGAGRVGDHPGQSDQAEPYPSPRRELSLFDVRC